MVYGDKSCDVYLCANLKGLKWVDIQILNNTMGEGSGYNAYELQFYI